MDDPKSISGVLVCLPSDKANAHEWLTEHDLLEKVRLISIGATSSPSAIKAALTIRNLSQQTTIYVYWERARKLALTLTKLGITNFVFIRDPQYKKVKYDPEYYKNNRRNLIELYNTLEDEESRHVLASAIKYRITGDHTYLRVSPYTEYEHPIVKPLANEWVIDCGSANGKTSFRFASLTYPFGKVIAVEPDPSNIKLIQDNLSGKFASVAHQLVLENCAVSDKVGELRFEAGQSGSSHLSSTGNTTVLVDKLDNIIQRNKLTGTGTISFDVEGFELQALNGGKESIKKLRPKLQISAYHKADDFIELAKWIQANLTDYALFMGHHETYHTETDFYAIPRELLPREGHANPTAQAVTAIRPSRFRRWLAGAGQQGGRGFRHQQSRQHAQAASGAGKP